MARLSQDARGVVEAGRRLWLRGMVAANDGNISIRLGGGRFLSTPTGRSKGFLEPHDLVLTDGEGRVLRDGRPTSELGMHLAIYRARPDAGAVVHAHPPAATAFAAAGLALEDCLLAEAALVLGKVPVVPFEAPGSDDLARRAAEQARQCDVFLLGNHGAVALGQDLQEAYFKMETLEHAATVALHVRQLGGGRPLSCTEASRLEALRERYGLAGPFLSCRPASGGEAACSGESELERLVERAVEMVLARLKE